MSGIRNSVKWAIFVLLFLWLSWRIITVNIAQHLVQAETPSASSWAPEHAEVLLLQAAQTMAHDPDGARRLALRAAQTNPTDSRPVILTALIWEQQGQFTLADGAMRLADKLTPRRSASQLQIANYWARRGQIDRALPHWSVALEMRPNLHQELFPVLLRLAESSQFRPAFSSFLRNPPTWWNGFFAYALNNAASKDTLKAIYHVRANSPGGIGEAEHKAYLDHLQRSGEWNEAYFVWLNGLDPKQMSALGNLYDGSFEHEPSDLGYGWRFARDDGFLAINEPTYGAVGAKALRITYNGTTPRQQQPVTQFLMLDPGSYKLHGRVRLDGLAAGDGLRWVIACVQGGVLGQSEAFSGMQQWQPFSIDFSVEANTCTAQKITLIMNKSERPLLFAGSAWFDGMYIEQRH